MVTARAPARALGDIRFGDLLRGLMGETTFQPFKFTRPEDSVEQMEIVGAVRRTLPTLSPATRRMLDALRLALTVRADPAQGYEFRGFVSRADIAAAMDKARLVPYDVEKLNKLVAAHLIVEDYHALPTMTVRGANGQDLQYGAGGEFIYQIPSKIMYALIFISDPGAFSILKLRGEAKAAALQARASRATVSSASAAAYIDHINQAAAVAAPAPALPLIAEPRRIVTHRTGSWHGLFNQPTWVYFVLALLAVAAFAGTWVVMSMLVR
ncbi:MAG: hypothetical protein GC204_11235 [Chloroflexi bacterium]|nr:hypothetical protein [Chloroflexota bacterium]